MSPEYLLTYLHTGRRASCSSFPPRATCLYLRTRSRRSVVSARVRSSPLLPRDNKMRITLVALLAACSAALRCSPQYRPLAQRRCSIVAQAELAPLPSQLGRVAAWAGEVVVVKYGGHAMTDPELSKSFAADCALMQSLGVRLVVVHGGGPQINAMLKKLEIKSEFVAGLRVTDSATMDAAEMVLCGSINKQIASSITLAGGRAVGLSGGEDETDPDPNPTRPDPDPNRPSPGCELKPSPNPRATPRALTLALALPLTSALDPRPIVPSPSPLALPLPHQARTTRW